MAWIQLLVISGLAGAGIVLAGNYVLHLITWGNPRVLLATFRVCRYVLSVPATGLFRWRVGEGLRIVVYDAEADEEKEVPAGIHLDRYGPSLIFWMWGDRPHSREFVARRALYDLALRIFCFFSLFLGSFVVLLRLAVTVSWYWTVALVFLAVHQLASAHTRQYILWIKPQHIAAMVIGVFVYLQGGAFQTIAVCAVGAHFVVSTLATWTVMKNRHLQDNLRMLGQIREATRGRPPAD